MKVWQLLHWKTRQRLKAALGAAVLAPIISLIDLPFLEAPLYDLWTRAIPRVNPSHDLVLVAIDERSANPDELVPLPMKRQTEILRALVAQQPSEIGLLVDFRSVEQIDPSGPGGFRAQAPSFIKAVQDAQDRGISVVLGTPFDVSGEVMPPRELSALPRAVGVLHRDGNVFAKDDVVRRALLSLYGRPTFHARIAGVSHLPGGFDVSELDARFAFFSYSGDPARAPYPVVSALDLLRGVHPPLRGKTVLLGTLSREQPNDFVKTPWSRDAETSPRLVVHAQIIDALRQHRSISVVEPWIQVGLVFLSLLATVGFVLVRSPLTSAAVAVGIGGLVLSITATAFWAGTWILAGQILIGIGIGYYVTVPLRLWTEYRARFDFQRKHEMLTQVEQLKSNFMSLVTHDLKTPVARIQGLAETLLSRLAGGLSAQDTEALKRITVATEDLNRFISSILELARIESNQVTLRRESKDINKIIEKTISEFGEVAKNRGQTLHAKLEPLFPVRVDGGLLTRVVSNLLDNAIKYSPRESEIVVESREQGSWIEIRVRDQGRPLTDEERGSLFQKFHRIPREGDSTAGTGLGLYLSKYFVEAHRGELGVESMQDGNTFFVKIPLTGGEAVRRS